MAPRPPRSRARRRARSVAAPEPALTRELRAIIAALAAGGVRFALVGGLAVSARAEPRLTRDVDIAVAVRDDREAEEVIRGLAAHGYSVDSTVDETRTKRLADGKTDEIGRDPARRSAVRELWGRAGKRRAR